MMKLINSVFPTIIACACLILLTAGSANKAKYSQASLLLDKNQPEQALAETKRLLKTDSRDITALRLKARAFAMLGRAREALETNSSALEIDPEDAEAHMQRGQIFNDLGERKHALYEFQTAIKFKPNWAEARNSSAIAKFHLGDSEGAINDLDVAIKTNPRFASAWANRGAILFRIGQLERAKKDLDQSLRLQPNNPETLNNRGRTLHAMKRFDEAIKDFDRAIVLAPKKSDWYNNKALSLAGAGRHAEALTWYTKAIELKPSDATAIGNRGATYVRLKRFTEAEKDLRHALAINPNYAPAHNNLAALLGMKGKLSKAKAESDRALQLDPTSSAYHANRATILAQEGKLEESLLDFETSRSNRAENGNRTTVSVSDFQALVSTYKRVLKLHPNDKEAYYNLAFAYFCMKSMPLALTNFDIFLRMATPNSKSALSAAIMTNLAHRKLGHDAALANKDVQNVLKTSSDSLKGYWAWNLASYLNGKTSARELLALKLNKTSTTQLKCYYAIDRSLAGDLAAATKELNWIKLYGDREIDEFDLAMSWFQTPTDKVRSPRPQVQSKQGSGTGTRNISWGPLTSTECLPIIIKQ